MRIWSRQVLSFKWGILLMPFLFLALLVSFVAPAHEKQWPEKRLRQVWPQAQTFAARQVTLEPGQLSQLGRSGIKLGAEDRSPTFYIAKGKTSSSSQSKSLGVIIFIDEYGANGKMEISVAIDVDGRTKKIDIWSHAENVAVNKDEFLGQFIGKTSKESFIQNKDYKPVPDALKASGAVASAVEKALKITNLVFEKK